MSRTKIRLQPVHSVVVIEAVRMFDNLPMTQTQLAEEIGVRQATVSRWASGKTSLTVMEMGKVEAVCRKKVLSVLSDLNTLRSTLNELEKVQR